MNHDQLIGICVVLLLLGLAILLRVGIEQLAERLAAPGQRKPVAASEPPTGPFVASYIQRHTCPFCGQPWIKATSLTTGCCEGERRASGFPNPAIKATQDKERFIVLEAAYQRLMNRSASWHRVSWSGKQSLDFELMHRIILEDDEP